MDKLLLLLVLLFNFSNANAVNLKGEYGVLSLEAPKSFKLYKNFLGLPYIFIKKEENQKNTSISVIPTGVMKIDLDPKLLEKNYDKYKNGRKMWAKKRGQKILDFEKFKSFKNKSNNKVIFAGYRYETKTKIKNLEHSYYILCPKETFQVKLLTLLDSQGEKWGQLLDKNIKASFCL